MKGKKQHFMYIILHYFKSSIGLAKKFLWFLSKNKTFFVFIKNFIWTAYLPFCSTTFCHFSDNFIIPSPQNFLPFWGKNCSSCLLQFSRELNFFPLREFSEEWNKWTSEGAMSGAYGQWIRTYQLSSNRHEYVTWNGERQFVDVIN